MGTFGNFWPPSAEFSHNAGVDAFIRGPRQDRALDPIARVLLQRSIVRPDAEAKVLCLFRAKPRIAARKVRSARSTTEARRHRGVTEKDSPTLSACKFCRSVPSPCLRVSVLKLRSRIPSARRGDAGNAAKLWRRIAAFGVRVELFRRRRGRRPPRRAPTRRPPAATRGAQAVAKFSLTRRAGGGDRVRL